MPRYIAHFVETVEYSIEFESDEEIKDDGSDAWFNAMEQDPANLDWTANATIVDRTLNELESLCGGCGLSLEICDCPPKDDAGQEASRHGGAVHESGAAKDAPPGL